MKREAARALLVSASYEKTTRRNSSLQQQQQQQNPNVFQVQVHQPRKSLTSSTDDVFSHVESEPIATAKSNTVQHVPRTKPESLHLR